MKDKHNILVVGAGFSGSVIARHLAENGYSIHIIDKRDHVAGNAYDLIGEKGIRYHKYGPHLFHTNNKKVFEWLSRFTKWTAYKHKVKAMLPDGSTAVLPPNIQTINKVGSKEDVVDKFFRPYTLKMWGAPLEELDPSIINRVSIRDDYNEYYFPNDEYQAMPLNGYTELIKNILDHKNIEIFLNKEFIKEMEDDYYHVFNSMPIDEYYKYINGELPYRSIKFHHVTLPFEKVLPSPTLNFTHDLKFTRATEWKQFPNHSSEIQPWSHITYEEPCDYKDNNYERYYPVKDLDGVNRKKYDQYKSIKNKKVTFIGRCGMYVYIDMHQAVSSALAQAKKWILNNEQS